MTDNNRAVAIKKTYPDDLPIMYTYQLLAKVMEAGKPEPEIREVKLVDTNPEDALRRAQEQIKIEEKPGQIVEWFVNFAGELVPEEAMHFYHVHANNVMNPKIVQALLAVDLLPILERLEDYHGDSSIEPLRAFYETLIK